MSAEFVGQSWLPDAQLWGRVEGKRIPLSFDCEVAHARAAALRDALRRQTRP